MPDESEVIAAYDAQVRERFPDPLPNSSKRVRRNYERLAALSMNLNITPAS